MSAQVLIVTDAAGWALDGQAYGVFRAVSREVRSAVVAYVPPWIRGRIIHFLNRYAALEGDALSRTARQNRVIVSWTHGGAYEAAPAELRLVIEAMRRVAELADIVHVSASLYQPIVEGLGVPRDRIRLVPFGIDVARFDTEIARADARRHFGIPADAPCIGSFQRDGEDRPKLVKGPDVLVELAARLHRRYPSLVVLLSGPARGFVRRQLSERGIPFHYAGLVPQDEIPLLYRACDTYVITSREEGGPLGLIEAMASGVPVVSTRVGMAPDVIADGVNGILADVDDVDSIEAGVVRVLSDPDAAAAIAASGCLCARRYDWSEVGPRYLSMYQELR